MRDSLSCPLTPEKLELPGSQGTGETLLDFSLAFLAHVLLTVLERRTV